jgi:hypothetical protein
LTLGWHLIIRCDQHDVAGYNLLGRDLGLRAVAAHPRRRLHHRLQRIHRVLGLAGLPQPDESVDERWRVSSAVAITAPFGELSLRQLAYLAPARHPSRGRLAKSCSSGPGGVVTLPGVIPQFSAPSRV